MITNEINKFIEFRDNLTYIIANCYWTTSDEYDNTNVEINPEATADNIIQLIKEYESESEDKPLTKEITENRLTKEITENRLKGKDE